MNAKELIGIMQKSIEIAKGSKIKVFTIESIESWINKDLAELVNKTSPTKEETEHYSRVAIPTRLEGFNGQNSQDVEVLKAVFLFGGAALKSAILINGGAAVALLAFMGSIFIGKPDVVKELTCPLMVFTSGVLSAAIASSASYFSQGYYSRKNESAGNFWRRIAIICVVFSYILFAVGTRFSGNIFS